MSSRNIRQASVLRRSTLTIALAMGLGLTGGAFAQSTTGTIFGQAAAGETIQVSGSTGVTREVPVDATGRYRLGNLPLGTYTVNVVKDGNVVDSRKNVQLTVGQGTEISFVTAAGSAGGATSLDQVTVTANSLPPIDVSGVDSRTVVTSETLARLPLGRNAESIALLAPGAVAGAGIFGRTVSFGGAGVTENAYYINGYNTSDPLKNLGGVGLPYGAIDQQEVYTGGYSAMYGRSDGGVINQVGKRGTNEWHFGAQVLWQPKFAASSPKNIYYPDAALPPGYLYQHPELPGTIYRNREDNKAWTTTYSAYAGGPLIKDKLFMFVAAEAEKTEGRSTNSIESSIEAYNKYQYNLPKYYAKLDWNINDSNILELTGIKSTDEAQGQYYDYDYATNTDGAYYGAVANHTKLATTYGIAKYTSYITDSLTFSATYGKSHTTDYFNNPSGDGQPYIGNINNQNPAYTGGPGKVLGNFNPTYVSVAPDAGSRTHGLRADLEWHVGDHLLTAGMDNMKYNAENEGQSMSGPGYAWYYGKSNFPNRPISAGLGVGAPGGEGYYAYKYILVTTTSMSVDQKAYYLEDKWQVADNVLLSIGVRNDKFTNYNNVGAVYVASGNQWAPRFGASWDVFGDSSLKIYGNLGRYFLALPNSVAIRGASSSTFTREYFTYTGIDQSGNPTGLAALGPGPVSSNGEYGQANDAKSVAATDLKSQYQDEVILGFDKTLGSSWVTGAKFTLRKLQAAIDDVCDTDKIIDKLDAQGVNTDNLVVPGCVIFNPGKTNTFSLENGASRQSVTMSTSDWGFKQGAKRKYYALNMYLEHPFDGKWQGRLDYTFSRSYGNTEGQVKSDIGQDDVSKTQDWDAAALMENANGLLANNRTHQIKAYGSYQVAPEWMLSAVVRVQSGSPKTCLGFYAGSMLDSTGAPGGYGEHGTDPLNYGSSYHYCNGQPSHPGDSSNPWTKQLDLAVTYRPAFADSKLALSMNVFNVTNERKPIQVGAQYEALQGTVSNIYNMGTYFQTPRYMRLTATYDF
ncbi:outer membrane receptor protein involved in Fe transport [Luteibacter sp. Sphag1AF]|uniref:carboxypeptidase regulatory-like domain-containing protein n=1 Tax=Luteibacter sp. Sphag1AF TaxID=2587031 RepID=UPI0016074BC7|nr:carboxypeptidase regulatory-like domain-containing protein [Luteibacter sp. Sphag1AF]MBB3228020.1 outer membrane receptor protein involved in Fe transport [Luteibacter sp. Sphag1AF]